VNFEEITRSIAGKVTFVCGGLDQRIFRKPWMRGKFDLMLFGLLRLGDVGDTAKALVRGDSGIVLTETARYVITFSDKEKIKAAETIRKKCCSLGWTLKKDVSEPPQVPVGHLDRDIYWLDDEDTLDAYIVWQASTSEEELEKAVFEATGIVNDNVQKECEELKEALKNSSENGQEKEEAEAFADLD